MSMHELMLYMNLQVKQALDVDTEREFHVVYRNRDPKPGRHEIVVSLKQIEVSFTLDTHCSTPYPMLLISCVLNHIAQAKSASELSMLSASNVSIISES